MAYRANQQLREDIWDYRYASPGSMPAEDEKIVSFARQPSKHASPTALNLVQQAAEAQLYKANQELAAIEEMIRKRLL